MQNEELNKIANGLKKKQIRSVKVVVISDLKKQQIKKISYGFDFYLQLKKKVKLVNVKGNFVSKLNYELEFDNNWDKNIPLAEQILCEIKKLKGCIETVLFFTPFLHLFFYLSYFMYFVK